MIFPHRPTAHRNNLYNFHAHYTCMEMDVWRKWHRPRLYGKLRNQSYYLFSKYLCRDESYCIEPSDVCNGVNGCGDGSDENNSECPKPPTEAPPPISTPRVRTGNVNIYTVSAIQFVLCYSM